MSGFGYTRSAAGMRQFMQPQSRAVRPSDGRRPGGRRSRLRIAGRAAMLDQAARGFVMVPPVGLLSTLLHEASARRPAEVVIETDQPVRMHLPTARRRSWRPIGGTAISDELSDLLSTEQQVDLALGEQVKFDLVVGPYTWHLVGETASEVISVRARPTGELLDASDSVQIPIEPDDFDAFDALDRATLG
jgi:hypothetical protein